MGTTYYVHTGTSQTGFSGLPQFNESVTKYINDGYELAGNFVAIVLPNDWVQFYQPLVKVTQ